MPPSGHQYQYQSGIPPGERARAAYWRDSSASGRTPPPCAHSPGVTIPTPVQFLVLAQRCPTCKRLPSWHGSLKMKIRQCIGVLMLSACWQCWRNSKVDANSGSRCPVSMRGGEVTIRTAARETFQCSRLAPYRRWNDRVAISGLDQADVGDFGGRDGPRRLGGPSSQCLDWV